MVNSNLRVSAIITTHNRKVLLKRSIESVFSQTYPNIELIVVDDASTDGTDDYCKVLSLRYIYISKQESKGGNYARNLGIKAATGEYVAFLDDDDDWLPSKIEKQVTLLENSDCELVYCGRRLEIISKDNIKYVDLLPNKQYQGNMRKKILLTICATTSTILAKRQSLFEAGLFDENLGFWQEYELTIRMAQRKPFYFVNEPLCVYRIDTQDNLRLTNKFDRWKDAVRYIHLKHAELYKSLNYLECMNVCVLVWGDALNRAKNGGFWMKYCYYALLFNIVAFPIRSINWLKKYYSEKV